MLNQFSIDCSIFFHIFNILNRSHYKFFNPNDFVLCVRILIINKNLPYISNFDLKTLHELNHIRAIKSEIKIINKTMFL